MLSPIMTTTSPFLRKKSCAEPARAALKRIAAAKRNVSLRANMAWSFRWMRLDDVAIESDGAAKGQQILWPLAAWRCGGDPEREAARRTDNQPEALARDAATLANASGWYGNCCLSPKRRHGSEDAGLEDRKKRHNPRDCDRTSESITILSENGNIAGTATRWSMKSAAHWSVWVGAIVLGSLGLASAVAFYRSGRRPDPGAHAEDPPPKDLSVPVKVIHPIKGQERLSTQPGSIQAYESVRIFGKVPGFLKKQWVDIGDRVRKDQELLGVDVPEL